MNHTIDHTIYSEGDRKYIISNGIKMEEGKRYTAKWGFPDNLAIKCGFPVRTARSCYVKKIFYPRNQKIIKPFIILQYDGLDKNKVGRTMSVAVNIDFLTVV